MELAGVKFDLEMLNAKDEQSSIHLHDSLRKGFTIGNGHYSKLLRIIYSPIFLKKQATYYLIARHWAYCSFVDDMEFTFPGLIIYKEELIPQIHQIEDMEFSLFGSLGQSAQEPKKTDKTKTLSKTTQSRQKALQKGRVCPICGGALLTPLRHIKDKNGYYNVSCFNKSRRKRSCDFYCKLTEYEFQKFKKYEYPIEQWLTKINGASCPKCKSEVFLRTIRSENKTEQWEKCRYHHQSTSKECKHVKRVG